MPEKENIERERSENKEKNENPKLESFTGDSLSEALSSADSNARKTNGSKEQEAKSEKQKSAPHANTLLDAIEKKQGKDAARLWKDSLLARSAKNLEARKILSESADKALKEKDESVKTGKPASIRTFKSDLRELIQKDKLSITKIAAIESDSFKEKSGKKQTKDGGSGSGALVILASLVLLFSSFALLAYYFFETKKVAESENTLSPVAESLINKVVFIEERIKIDISGKSRVYIMNILAAARDSDKISRTLGNVIEFELLEKNENGSYKRAKIKDLIKKIYPNYPETFVNTLSDDYMFGVHVTENGREPFIILKTRSYHYAFSAMLEWEKSIVNDLGSFMIKNVRAKEFVEDVVQKPDFQDVIVQNLNARVLRDINDNIDILYGFVGKDTLIISNNVKTFTELAKRVRLSGSR